MKTVLMTAPFSSRSGYGDHARSIFYALNDSKKYNIHLWDVRWGDTPKDFLKNDIERHQQILNRFLREPKLDSQPDIYIDIRIPNEFETFGKYNIGITAGIETTAISHKWIEGCNKMNLIIVPSQHSKNSIVSTVFDKIENLPDGSQKKSGEERVTTPVEVVFEGTDEEIYKPLKVGEIERSFLNYMNDTVAEKFAFLFVGQWVKGGYGEDRKDIFKLIKIFYETFANLKKKPALILKTSGASFSILDFNDCRDKINSIKSNFPSDWSLPNVYLLHGSLSDEEMNLLYNHPKIKALASFTHGEGFGRPLLEATMVGLPVICSKWSGPIDFLDERYASLIDGSLENVPKSAVWEDIIIPESKWFCINEHDAYKKLKDFTEEIFSLKEKAKSLMKINREKFTLNKMSSLINEIIDRHIGGEASKPSLSSLKLPKLKKAENKDSNNKFKLPKLKKI